MSRPRIMEGFLLMMMFVWLLISVLTAIHAQDNGKTALWGVAVLFFGIIGLVGYAISLAAE